MCSNIPYGRTMPLQEPLVQRSEPLHVLYPLIQPLHAPSPELVSSVKQVFKLTQPFFWNERRKGVLNNLISRLQSIYKDIKSSKEVVKAAKAKVNKCEKHLQRLHQNVASSCKGKAGRAKKANLKVQIDIHAKSLEEYKETLLKVAKREFDYRNKLKREFLDLRRKFARVDSMEPPEFQAPDYFFGYPFYLNGHQVYVATPKSRFLFKNSLV